MFFCNSVLLADFFRNFRRGKGILPNGSCISCKIFIICLRTDHGGIVSAQAQRRHIDRNTQLLSHLLQICTQPGVCRNTACRHQRPHAGLLCCQLEPRYQCLTDCPLEGCRQIAFVNRLALLLRIVRQIDHRRFQAGKGEIQWGAVYMGMGQDISPVIAALGKLVNFGTAGISYTQYTGYLVKGFARRIIPCSA